VLLLAPQAQASCNRTNAHQNQQLIEKGISGGAKTMKEGTGGEWRPIETHLAWERRRRGGKTARGAQGATSRRGAPFRLLARG